MYIATELETLLVLLRLPSLRSRVLGRDEALRGEASGRLRSHHVGLVTGCHSSDVEGQTLKGYLQSTSDGFYDGCAVGRGSVDFR